MEAKKKDTEISRGKEKIMPVEKKAAASIPKNVEVKKTEKTVTPAKQVEKKPVAKKTTTKVPAAEKPIAKTIAAAFVEFAGNQINILDVIESAKAHYKALYEKENGVIKDISVYVKPDENVAYYVVNGVGSDNYKVGI